MAETTQGRHAHQGSWIVSYEPDVVNPTGKHYEWHDCGTCKQVGFCYPHLEQIPEGVTLRQPEKHQAIYDALYPSE